MDSFMVPDSDICLGIPVPQFVQDLLPDIPSPPESSVDDDIRSAIEVFGRGDERTTSDQIVKACELAQGYDDLVILLQQPVASHNYSKPFAEFVYASPTRKAVDEALRFVTKGRRSINNTSVLDAFMFKTWQGEEEGDFKRHDLVKRLLHIKKPGASMKLKALERALDEQLAMGPTESSSVGPSEAHPSELAGECVDKLKSALRVISAGRDLLCSKPDVPKDPDRSHSAVSGDIGLKTVVQKVILEGMVSLKGLVTSMSTLIETLEDQSEMLRTPTMRGSRTGQRTPTAIRDSAALTSADNAVMRVMFLRRQLAQIAIGNTIEVEATAPKSEESRISFKKKTRGRRAGVLTQAGC
ncbi:hypothetical protein B9Z65_5259 [Elsinoe australis]|uniref:Uncharacterized protein n=1 Tax=Elsinoe australis TaxID=40998 RepID=A0A2P7ZDN8_9PEZI|nr:hypothetical protein B9Z65_5259 [Elsinoe australis]